MEKCKSHILFYSLETNSSLFELKLRNKYPLWDIVRFHIWMKVSNNDADIFLNNNKNRVSIKNILNSFFSLRIILFNRFDNLFYTCSRLPNVQNEYFDPYFEKIKNCVDGKWVCYETMIGKNKYANNEIIFDCIGYLKKIFSSVFKLIAFFDNNHSNEIFSIVNTCNNHYEKKIISEFEIKMLIIHFNFELFYYKFIFNVLGLKNIFYHGYSKSLVQAAVDLNIPRYEFQHGEITDTTICYIYPKNVNNFISPNILFTYSEIWTCNKNIPYQCIPVGSVNNYSIKLKEIELDNSIVIMSSPYQSESLVNLAIELSIVDPTLLIHFKLHPMEFHKFEYYKVRFSEYKMISLIDIKVNIFEVLSFSNDFVLIYSTTLYEIIHFKKNAYIYKSSNIFQEALFIGDIQVPIFDTPETFFAFRNSTKFNSSIKVDLFKPFNQELFKLSI
jgi:hypothetical protein